MNTYEALEAETIAEVAKIFQTAVDEHKMAGVTWGIARGGEVLASGGAGLSHLENGEAAEGAFAPELGSISRIASMTKSFTVATILALRDEGKLRLDDPLEQHLPEARGIGRASEDSPAITIRHCLTMSAGFVTDNPWGDRQESMDAEELAELLEGGLGFIAEPGTAFEYSNTGYVLLGRVIDEVTGSNYRDEIRLRFLEPLGMKDSFFDLSEATDEQRARVLTGHRISDAEGAAHFEAVDVDSTGVFGAMAGLYSSVPDVAKWTAFLAEVNAEDGAGSAEHRALLSVASRREMQEIHRIQEWPALPENAGFARVRGYGYGLVVEKFPTLGDVISHSGGYPGYGSYMVWLRHSGLTVIALANSKYAPAIPCSIQALEKIREMQPQLIGTKRVQLNDVTSRALDAALAWLREDTGEGAEPQLVPSGSARAVLARREADGYRPDTIASFFATNMDQDVSRAERLRLRDKALQIAGLTRADLTREGAASVGAVSPYQARVQFEGPSGSIQLDLLMDPRREGQIQALNLKGTAKDAAASSGTAPIGI